MRAGFHMETLCDTFPYFVLRIGMMLEAIPRKGHVHHTLLPSVQETRRSCVRETSKVVTFHDVSEAVFFVVIHVVMLSLRPCGSTLPCTVDRRGPPSPRPYAPHYKYGENTSPPPPDPTPSLPPGSSPLSFID